MLSPPDTWVFLRLSYGIIALSAYSFNPILFACHAVLAVCSTLLSKTIYEAVSVIL
jgi:hypothetical protein